MKPSLWIPFFIAISATILLSAIFPQLKILTLSPFLAIVYNRTSFEKTLWIAASSGLILDLLNSDLRFGMYSLLFTFTTLVLYKQRYHFFEDKPQSLCLFTLIISALTTIIRWVISPLSGITISFSYSLLATDLILLPLADALYALTCFYYPLKIYIHIQKVGFRAWITRTTHEAH